MGRSNRHCKKTFLARTRHRQALLPYQPQLTNSESIPSQTSRPELAKHLPLRFRPKHDATPLRHWPLLHVISWQKTETSPVTCNCPSWSLREISWRVNTPPTLPTTTRRPPIPIRSNHLLHRRSPEARSWQART